MTDSLEMIGKVRLNKQWYRGDDRYSDGDETENRLLDVVRQQAPGDYNATILREGSWPLLYHLSPIRENIVRWYPFREGASVLELGAGCGAVTGALLGRGLQVCAVDLSLRRCRINATRHADSPELEICVGAIEDVLTSIDRKFDYVLLIGVLEYAAVFSDAADPQVHMLDCIRRVMKPDAEAFVAIENKLGLKYLSGCREDHTGRFFEGVEGYPHADGPLTFSKRELEGLFERCGFESAFYYPYPDYKFPISVYTDARGPARGELNRNWHCFDAKRIQLFDESRAADAMIDAGLMADLANSFLVKLTNRGRVPGDEVLFVKASVERKPEYRHFTLILRRGAECVVRKVPASERAEAHLRQMDACREQLSAALKEGAGVGIAPCTVNADGTIDFPYYSHDSLRNALSRLRGDAEAFCREIEKFARALSSSFGTVPFEDTEAFRALFGDARLENAGDALSVTDLDLNFDNVFIDGDGRYVIVDYEWVVPFPVPLSFVLYRALLVNADMMGFSEEERDMIWGRLGVDEALRETYFNMELGFQRYVSGEDNKLEAFKNRDFGEDGPALRMEELLLRSRLMEEYKAASQELTKQRDEYHRANDELWKRVEIAEKNLSELTAAHEEFVRKHTPFWRKLKR